MADSTLNAIRIKVRRLTRSPSINQVPDADIDEYINTFVLYDMPSHLKLFSLRKTFSFYTEPNVATYSTNTTDVNNPLYNFKNALLTSSDPIYIGGRKAWFSQSREEFFNRWTTLKQKVNIGVGDGITTVFSGTLTESPITPNETLFTSIDVDGVGIGLVSRVLIDSVTGVTLPTSNLYSTEGPIPSTDQLETTFTPANFVNSVNSSYSLTFNRAPASGAIIYAQYLPYQPARPTSVLFFDNTFTLRPIPDIQYDVKIECDVRPSELLSVAQSPDLEQWWQYIAYGAAKKLLEDRTDMETVQLLMPEFMKQEKLVLRRTLNQQGDQRAATIYSEQASLDAGPWGWWNSQ